MWGSSSGFEDASSPVNCQLSDSLQLCVHGGTCGCRQSSGKHVCRTLFNNDELQSSYGACSELMHDGRPAWLRAVVVGDLRSVRQLYATFCGASWWGVRLVFMLRSNIVFRERASAESHIPCEGVDDTGIQRCGCAGNVGSSVICGGCVVSYARGRCVGTAAAYATDGGGRNVLCVPVLRCGREWP